MKLELHLIIPQNFTIRVETVSLADLAKIENRLNIIMKAIEDYFVKQAEFNTRISTAIDSLIVSNNDLSGDINGLNDKIAKLTISTDPLTDDQKATLTALQTQGEAAATRLEGVAAALKILDDQTPPTAPPV